MSKLLVSLMVLLAATTVQAQNFPETEKEVKEILCSGKWKADSIFVDGKGMPAADLLGEMYITFTTDGIYAVSLMGAEKKGAWKVNMAKKRVDILEKREEPETLVTTVAPDRLVLNDADITKDDESMTITFKPAK
jgi:hypothetical protein